MALYCNLTFVALQAFSSLLTLSPGSASGPMKQQKQSIWYGWNVAAISGCTEVFYLIWVLPCYTNKVFSPSIPSTSSWISALYPLFLFLFKKGFCRMISEVKCALGLPGQFAINAGAEFPSSFWCYSLWKSACLLLSVLQSIVLRGVEKRRWWF